MNRKGITLPTVDSRISLQSDLLAVRNCKISKISIKILKTNKQKKTAIQQGIFKNVNKCRKEGAFS